MKKIFILFIMILLIVGCGSKKSNNKSIGNDDKDTITYRLGSSDEVLLSDMMTCGDKQIQSKVIFNQDGTASYEFYDCKDDNVILETSSGNYMADDLDITLTNSYGEKLFFEITGNKKIELKDGSNTIRSFTN